MVKQNRPGRRGGGRDMQVKEGHIAQKVILTTVVCTLKALFILCSRAYPKVLHKFVLRKCSCYEFETFVGTWYVRTPRESWYIFDRSKRLLTYKSSRCRRYPLSLSDYVNSGKNTKARGSCGRCTRRPRDSNWAKTVNWALLVGKSRHASVLCLLLGCSLLEVMITIWSAVRPNAVHQSSWIFCETLELYGGWYLPRIIVFWN